MDKKKVITFLIYTIIVASISVFLTMYYFDKTVKIDNQVLDERLAPEKIEEVLAKLSDNILLPEDEDPLLAVITDIDALVENQLFYKDASNGDYIIVYQNSARAILYNFDLDKIINVGPIQYTDDGSQPTNENGGDVNVEEVSGEDSSNADPIVSEEAATIDEPNVEETDVITDDSSDSFN